MSKIIRFIGVVIVACTTIASLATEPLQCPTPECTNGDKKCCSTEGGDTYYYPGSGGSVGLF